MFYTGWQFFAPTSMNVSALSAEMRHAHASSYAGTPFVSLEPLTDFSAASPSTAACATVVAGKAANDVATASTKSKAQPPGRARRRHRPPQGCVLHLAPRPVLSYKEMEQQLQRRTSGASDCFHVKSNLPLLAQAGVLFMECVVSHPTATDAGDGAAVTHPAAKEVQDSKARHPLPALVIGVCQRQLPWFHLPGEASDSIGFYVTQRHIMKHGSDDRDEVVVPCEPHRSNGSSSGTGGGGGRIGEGDFVGCLVDLIQHTLSFTVNRHVVSTHSMDPAYGDGSLYFAVGMARRPQHATDVTVRFFTGSQCLSSTTPSSSTDSSAPFTAASHQQRHLRDPSQPRFPLAQYVRTLAIASVRQRVPGGDVRNVSVEHPAAASDFAAAISGDTGGGALSPTDAFQAPAAAPSVEAMRDLRIAAVLRDYLSVRGMAGTLKTLDEELDRLAPSHALLYPMASTARNGEKGLPSPTSQSGKKALTEQQLQCPVPDALQSTSHSKSGDAVSRCVAPQAGETRAAWQAYAAHMAELRRTLLLMMVPPAPATSNSPAPLSSAAYQLLTNVVWKPSLIVAFMRFFKSDDSSSGSETRATTTSSRRLPSKLSSVPHAAVAASHGHRARGGHQVKHTPQASTCCLDSSAASPVLSLSPFESFHALVDPALLTLSFLTLRQDVRYLLHAHYAVEEMWRRLRAHLRRAHESCDTVTRGKAPGVGLPSTNSASVASAMDAERQEAADFTAFFVELMWDAKHTVPSAAAAAAAATALVQNRRGGGKGVSREAAASPIPLQAKALETLAKLAGHASELPRQLPLLQPDTQDDTGAAEVKCEAQQFCTLAAAAAAARPTLLAEASKSATSSSWVASAAAQAELRRSSSPYVEEAVLFLYHHAVVPAAAPSRSSQVRLLQTLCSLFTHTLSTLRLVERRTRSFHQDKCNTPHAGRTELHCSSSNGDDSPVGVHAAVASIHVLEKLLDAVQQRLRQLVWRRLLHALEDVNAQLQMRLSMWHTVADGVAPEAREGASKAQRDTVGPAKSRRHHREPISGWTTDYRMAEEEEAAVSEAERDGDEHDPASSNVSRSDDGTAANTHVQAKSLTASFLSFQTAESPEEDYDNDGDDDDDAVRCDGEEKAGAAAMPARPAELAYEAVTEALPSLRHLYRRVAARAALEPSRHLVTDLFVQELRASLTLAPPVGWRVEGTELQHTGSSHACKEMPASSAAASNAVGTDRSEETVTVKRPPTMAAEAGSAMGDDGAEHPRDTAGTGHGAAMAEEAQWFTEELYLSSVYMKRVLKHLSGR
jgi:hypothetical protein